MNAPYIASARLKEEHSLDPTTFPGNLPILKGLNLTIDTPVTFFVGENGSGKSTLLEALAVVAKLPVAGGGTRQSVGPLWRTIAAQDVPRRSVFVDHE